MQVNNLPIVEFTLFYSANNWLVLKYGNSLFKNIYAKKMQTFFISNKKALNMLFTVLFFVLFYSFLQQATNILRHL